MKRTIIIDSLNPSPAHPFGHRLHRRRRRRRHRRRAQYRFSSTGSD